MTTCKDCGLVNKELMWCETRKKHVTLHSDICRKYIIDNSKIELTKVERINEGNLLSFDVDNGDIRFSVIQYDNDYSYVNKALEIVAS